MKVTQMELETRQAPQIINDQLVKNKTILQQVAKEISHRKPSFAVTIGRGSSDHACTYAKYLLETYLSLPTASAAP